MHEKERRRERQKALKEGYAAGTLSPAEQAVVERRRELLRARKAASKGQEADVYPGAIVIDLGFDDLMTDGEITSMASQLTYVYSVNKSAKRPFAAVLHTSFGPETTPRLWEKLGKSMWSRWVRMHFWEQGLDVLADVMRKGEQEAVEEKETGTAGTSEENESSTEAHDGEADLRKALTGPKLPHTIPASSQLVYLSADADEELTTLSPNEVYVIGGIVDRNRHKMLCQNKAEKLGIRTARLPIGSFIDNLPTRKVLTVNQVCKDRNELTERYSRYWCSTMSKGTGKQHSKLSFRRASSTLEGRRRRQRTGHGRKGVRQWKAMSETIQPWRWSRKGTTWLWTKRLLLMKVNRSIA